MGDAITASALALSWLFYLLARRQADAQQKLIEELLSTVAESRAAVRDLALLAMDRERLSVNGLLYRELLEEQSRRRATAAPLLTVADCQRIARDSVGIADDAQVEEHLALLQGLDRLYCDDLGSPDFTVTVVA